MEQTLFSIVDGISGVLSGEKAYEINDVCRKYGIVDGDGYSSPNSKLGYIHGHLISKDEKFIVELAKKIVDDYKSDIVGLGLNQYFNGKFYKLSLVTRKELLTELFLKKDIQGALSVDDFLKACRVEIPFRVDFGSLFEVFSANRPKTPKNEPSLAEILDSNRFFEVLDEKFFRFLEQIVHPYTRSNNDALPYIAIINSHIRKDNLQMTPYGEISGESIYNVIPIGGVSDSIKNLIFASNGYKPDIVLEDAISNRIKIVRNSEYCLVYNRTIKHGGLLWVDLVEWWSERNFSKVNADQASALKIRLDQSLGSIPEKMLFDTYYQAFSKRLNRKLPALIPQIYLHYDPYSIKKHGIQYLLRQRMDFLILLSNNIRIVIEVDGKQHYANDDTAAPSKYAEMVSLDRELKLLGYEVYRFGGYELQHGCEDNIIAFFEKLFEKHKIVS